MHMHMHMHVHSPTDSAVPSMVVAVTTQLRPAAFCPSRTTGISNTPIFSGMLYSDSEEIKATARKRGIDNGHCSHHYRAGNELVLLEGKSCGNWSY